MVRDPSPALLPDLNTGNPWSEMDDADLLSSVGDGPVTESMLIEAAFFLCRNKEEVHERLKELGRRP